MSASLYRDNWDRRRWNHTNNSPRVRRAFRKAKRVREMPVAHWQAYLDGSRITLQQLIHNGRKP